MKSLGPWLYEALIDPLTRELRATIASMIPPGAEVVDLGCGTGALAFHMATFSSRVVGIDLSPHLITRAERKRQNKGLDHVSFLCADASSLEVFPPRSFDFAVLSLVLHEVPETRRLPLLREARRIAREILVADYHTPLPLTPAGLLVRVIEAVAGPSHFQGFLSFVKGGGVPPLLQATRLEIQEAKMALNGVVLVVKTGQDLPHV